MAHRETYNAMQYPPVIEKRTAVGSFVVKPRFGPTRKVSNIVMTAVLCNGRTVAQFLSESEADAYIISRWPNRSNHDNL